MEKATRTISIFPIRYLPDNAQPHTRNNFISASPRHPRTGRVHPCPSSRATARACPNDWIPPHPGQPQGLALPTIGDIIGTYKSLVANESLKIFKQNWVGPNPIPRMGKIWQRNYYEHIIRTERAYHHIAEYIINNPKNWEADKFHRNSQSSKPKKTENITF